MAKQMEEQMDFFEDGGLLDEGGMVDEESGNEVPTGSLREEVRDDIPAQLSEGEFVFPADVVRFYGLEKLMEMRQCAKSGLQIMEDMGQMGNSEEAILPDDIPFDLEDLDIEEEDEYNMAVGGFVQPQAGYGTTVMQPTPFPTQPSLFSNYTQQPATQPVFQPQPVQAPQQFTAPTYTVPTYTGPTFKQLLPTTTGQYDEMKTYVNTAGEERVIPFVNGQPIYPIPEGFTLKEEAAKVEEQAPTAVTTKTTRVTDRGGRDSGDTTSGATMSFGGSKNSKGTISGAMTGNISYSGIPGGIKGLTSIGATAAFTNILGLTEPVQLSEGQTATLSNVSVSDGLSRANVLGNQSITFTADQFNKLNKANVTSKERKELEDVAKEIGSVYSKLDTDLGLSYNQAKDIAQAMKDVAKEEERYQESLKTGETFTDDEDLGNAPTATPSNTGKGDGITGKSSGEGKGSQGYGGGIGTGGGGAGQSFGPTGGFNKGGLANKKPKPKQMKRGGLASKK